jgi:GNAT superfamily N-acetyltransferase
MIHVRLLTDRDVPAGMRLKEQAGWNQTEADWRWFLDLEPGGGFAAEVAGQVVGTVATCTFGPVAWVALMLVDVAFRRRGIGRALMTRALAHLEGQGVRSIRLDATPMGQPLYEQLGFITEHTLTRYEGMLPTSGGTGSGVEPVAAGDYPELLRLDQDVTGTDRRKLLMRLFTAYPDSLRVVRSRTGVEGFLTARPRSNALFIGPCLGTVDAGRRLFADAAGRFGGQHICMDVPMGNPPAVAEVERLGLTPVRNLVRMGRGERVAERLDQLWASSGPETG